MVAVRLSVADPAENLMDVLARVQGGEQIAVERYGEVIAMIGSPSGDSGATPRELAIALTRLPPLDDEFEADIEAVRANQRPPASRAGSAE